MRRAVVGVGVAGLHRLSSDRAGGGFTFDVDGRRPHTLLDFSTLDALIPHLYPPHHPSSPH